MPRGGVPGNRGGQKGRSGRKSKAEEFGLARLLDAAWSQRERVAVVKKLAALARQGNVKAAELLLAYAYGKPRQQHDWTSGGQTWAEIFATILSD